LDDWVRLRCGAACFQYSQSFGRKDCFTLRIYETCDRLKKVYVLYVQGEQMKRIAVNFRLEAELLELLKVTAKQKAISKTAMLEECLKATLSDSTGSNGGEKDHRKTAPVASGEIQNLVSAALEQKFNEYFKETENKIAQLQQDLADLRQSVHQSHQN
jgi:hypothetical protein